MQREKKGTARHKILLFSLAPEANYGSLFATVRWKRKREEEEEEEEEKGASLSSPSVFGRRIRITNPFSLPIFELVFWPRGEKEREREPLRMVLLTAQKVRVISSSSLSPSLSLF